MEVEDCETGQTMMVDSSDPGLQKHFKKKAEEREEKLDRLFKTIGVDKIEIAAETSYVEPLMKFFKIREKRL